MGTRSLTFVYNENNGIVPAEPIICMYRQFDGYPTGHGAELAEFLNSGRIVNGIPMGTKERLFNGMGCLAASMVAHFKNDVGGIYLYTPSLKSDYWQEYEYHVWEDKVEIRNPDDTIFSGSWEQFAKYCSKEQYGDVEIQVAPFELNDESVKELKEQLHKNVMKVVFQKTDGSERVMRCTLSEIEIPESPNKNKVKTRVPNPDVLAVWDVEEDGWRSFRWDSIKTVEVAWNV